mmetsp:Transcript_14612/g.41769  ORF Transcript_14612/g.41769 Transcript_14612/m.41769 type:complete len:364 (-) Transcript_14612:35-1126(-)
MRPFLGLFLAATAWVGCAEARAKAAAPAINAQSWRALGDGVSMLSVAQVRHKVGNPNFHCADCCMDGNVQVPCLDVDSCAAKGPKNGKYAFVLSQRNAPYLPKFLKNIEAMKAQARTHGIDILMVMRPVDIAATKNETLEAISGHGIRIVPVAWDTPPGMKWVPDNWTGNRGWCGAMDLIRLHMFNLTDYDAVAYYDLDIELQGDVTPVLRCAATGRLLTTTGPMSPINMGFIAVRPDRRLLKAAISFAQSASFNKTTGWAGAGFKPTMLKYVGAECGQGFVHTLFYKAHSNAIARRCLEGAGFGRQEQIGAAQVSGCVWNYQGIEQCGEAHKKFNCSRIRAHHKPAEPTGGSCTKLKEQRGA